MATETYMNKANRDRRAKELSLEGRIVVKRSSMRNQQMHPMYIEDYAEVTGIELTAADRGFGNTIYKTHFPVIYIVEYREWVLGERRG